MDKILINSLKLFAYHGVNPEEKENGQNFIFDIELSVNMNKACYSDHVEDTVSYAKVVKTVRRVFTSQKYDLLEKCAQVVSDAIFEEYPDVLKIERLKSRKRLYLRNLRIWVFTFHAAGANKL